MAPSRGAAPRSAREHGVPFPPLASPLHLRADSHLERQWLQLPGAREGAKGAGVVVVVVGEAARVPGLGWGGGETSGRRERAGMRSGAEEVAMARGGGGTAVYLQLGQVGGAGGGGARGARSGSSCRRTVPERPFGQPPRAAGAPAGEDASRPGEARAAAAVAVRWW